MCQHMLPGLHCLTQHIELGNIWFISFQETVIFYFCLLESRVNYFEVKLYQTQFR